MRAALLFFALVAGSFFECGTAHAATPPPKAQKKPKAPAAAAPKPSVAPPPAPADNAPKHWEVRAAPLSLLIGWITVEAGFSPNGHWAFGPSFTSYGISRIPYAPAQDVGSAFGLYVAYYLKALPENGWYFTAHAYRDKNVGHPIPDTAKPAYHSFEGSTSNLMAGYRWNLPHSLFVLAGAGVEMQNGKFQTIDAFTNALTENTTTTRFAGAAEAKIAVVF